MIRNSKSKQSSIPKFCSQSVSQSVRTQRNKILRSQNKKQISEKQNQRNQKIFDKQASYRTKLQSLEQKQQRIISPELLNKNQKLQLKIKNLQVECQQLKNKIAEKVTPDIFLQTQKKQLNYKLQNLQYQIQSQAQKNNKLNYLILNEQQNVHRLIQERDNVSLELSKFKVKRFGMSQVLRKTEYQINQLKQEAQSIEISRVYNEPSKDIVEELNSLKNNLQQMKKSNKIKIIEFGVCYFTKILHNNLKHKLYTILKKILKNKQRRFKIQHALRRIAGISRNYLTYLKRYGIKSIKDISIKPLKEQDKIIDRINRMTNLKSKSSLFHLWKKKWMMIGIYYRRKQNQLNKLIKLQKKFEEKNKLLSFSEIKNKYFQSKYEAGLFQRLVKLYRLNRLRLSFFLIKNYQITNKNATQVRRHQIITTQKMQNNQQEFKINLIKQTLFNHLKLIHQINKSNNNFNLICYKFMNRTASKTLAQKVLKNLFRYKKTRHLSKYQNISNKLKLKSNTYMQRNKFLKQKEPLLLQINSEYFCLQNILKDCVSKLVKLYKINSKVVSVINIIKLKSYATAFYAFNLIKSQQKSKNYYYQQQIQKYHQSIKKLKLINIDIKNNMISKEFVKKQASLKILIIKKLFKQKQIISFYLQKWFIYKEKQKFLVHIIKKIMKLQYNLKKMFIQKLKNLNQNRKKNHNKSIKLWISSIQKLNNICNLKKYFRLIKVRSKNIQKITHLQKLIFRKSKLYHKIRVFRNLQQIYNSQKIRINIEKLNQMIQYHKYTQFKENQSLKELEKNKTKFNYKSNQYLKYILKKFCKIVVRINLKSPFILITYKFSLLNKHYNERYNQLFHVSCKVLANKKQFTFMRILTFSLNRHIQNLNKTVNSQKSEFISIKNETRNEFSFLETKLVTNSRHIQHQSQKYKELDSKMEIIHQNLVKGMIKQNMSNQLKNMFYRWKEMLNATKSKLSIFNKVQFIFNNNFFYRLKSSYYLFKHLTTMIHNVLKNHKIMKSKSLNQWRQINQKQKIKQLQSRNLSLRQNNIRLLKKTDEITQKTEQIYFNIYVKKSMKKIFNQLKIIINDQNNRIKPIIPLQKETILSMRKPREQVLKFFEITRNMRLKRQFFNKYKNIIKSIKAITSFNRFQTIRQFNKFRAFQIMKTHNIKSTVLQKSKIKFILKKFVLRIKKHISLKISKCLQIWKLMNRTQRNKLLRLKSIYGILKCKLKSLCFVSFQKIKHYDNIKNIVNYHIKQGSIKLTQRQKKFNDKYLNEICDQVYPKVIPQSKQIALNNLLKCYLSKNNTLSRYFKRWQSAKNHQRNQEIKGLSKSQLIRLVQTRKNLTQLTFNKKIREQQLFRVVVETNRLKSRKIQKSKKLAILNLSNIISKFIRIGFFRIKKYNEMLYDEDQSYYLKVKQYQLKKLESKIKELKKHKRIEKEQKVSLNSLKVEANSIKELYQKVLIQITQLKQQNQNSQKIVEALLQQNSKIKNKFNQFQKLQFQNLLIKQ